MHSLWCKPNEYVLCKVPDFKDADVLNEEIAIRFFDSLIKSQLL